MGKRGKDGASLPLRLFSLLLSAILVASSFPAEALAEIVLEDTPLAASGTRDDFLSVVRAQPDGADRTRYNGHKNAWCADFVVWCARAAGVPDTVIPSMAACQSMVNWFKARGQWRPNNQIPQPGDIVFYASTNGGTSHHVGIVIGTSGTKVYTKEGNTGSSVVGTFYNRKAQAYQGNWGNCSYILGYGVPNYANPTPASSVTINSPVNMLGYKQVTISSNPGNAAIYYNTNDTTPNTSNARYAGPLKYTYTVLLRAMAHANGYKDSSTVLAVYVDRAATPPRLLSPISLRVRLWR